MTSCIRTHPELTGWIIYILPKKPDRGCPLWKLKGNKCKLITFHKPRLESDIGVAGKGTQFLMFTNLHRLGVIEWHFPLMCLCCFGTQLANWPLIRQAASRAATVTVERSVFWDGSSSSGSAALFLPLLCESNYCLGNLLRQWRSLSRNTIWQWAHIDGVNKDGTVGHRKGSKCLNTVKK